MPLDPELIRKIQKIHIKTNHLVNDVMAGEYLSAFQGLGMEFAEVREYQIGDDTRAIDWNVSSRMGKPFIKVYQEERELTVMLLVDVSASGKFGTYRSKKEVSAELAATLSFSAIKNQDKVGLCLFTDSVEKYIPPKKGRGHVWRVIEEVLTFNPSQKGTDISSALEYLGSVLRKKAICFLISDFLSKNYENALRIANKRFDIIAVDISDPKEIFLPSLGYVEFEDAETGRQIEFNTGAYSFIREYEKIIKRHKEEKQRIFLSTGVDRINVSTDKPFIDEIIKLFRKRERRR